MTEPIPEASSEETPPEDIEYIEHDTDNAECEGI